MDLKLYCTTTHKKGVWGARNLDEGGTEPARTPSVFISASGSDPVLCELLTAKCPVLPPEPG